MIDDLLFLYSKNLDYARRLVADVDDAQMAAQPAPLMNHPAWTLGHLAGTANFLLRLWGKPTLVPPTWKDRYGRDSKPSADRAIYESKKQLLDILERSHAAVETALRSMTEKDLSGPAPAPYNERFPTFRSLVIQMLSGHEQTHLGQLSAWRRVQGLPPV